MKELKSLSDPKNIEGMARFGIKPKNLYGISIPNLRRMAKKIGKNHALAEKLWKSGIHEARILAGMIDYPEKVSEKQVDEWVKDFDSWDVCDQVCMNLFDKLSFASEKAALAMIKAGLKIDKRKAGKELFEFYLKNGIDGDTAFSNFIKKHNKNMSDRILAAGINAYLDAKRHYLKPYPKVVPVLRKLKKNFKLGVVTDAPRLKAFLRLDSMGIADFFDVVVGFEGVGKPSKIPFRNALRKLKLKGEEVLMVGDWPERDILGAKKVGMKTCFARYGHWKHVKDSGADFEIDKFEELLKVVEKV